MTRVTRTTLADLWRSSLSRLEVQGVIDAPSAARSQAIAALIGRAPDETARRDEPADRDGACAGLGCGNRQESAIFR